MKNSLYLLCFVIGSFAACGLQEGKKTSTAPVPGLSAKYKIAQLTDRKDYVCGMTLNEETLSDTTLYNGKVYGFCNVGCKDEFRKNPTTYLTQP